MKKNQPKYNRMEEINLDKRDSDLTNADIENSILRLMQIRKPLYDEYGIKIEPFTRFIWICNLASYITEEVLLNRVIDFLKSNFESKEAFRKTENYLECIKELYSTEDFIKIKAIYYPIRAKYIAIMETLNPKNSIDPPFTIDLDKRMITHNFPFVEKALKKNFEIDYKEDLKKIPADIALEILNKRMEALTDLDFLYDTKNSLDIREYHVSTEKMLVDKIKQATPVSSHPKGNIKSDKINLHPVFDPNLWNRDCFELFKYLFDNYYKGTKRQLTNIWFYLKEQNTGKYVLKATKKKYTVFISDGYKKTIKNFDKAQQKWEDKDRPSIHDHRINFEDGLK